MEYKTLGKEGLYKQSGWYTLSTPMAGATAAKQRAFSYMYTMAEHITATVACSSPTLEKGLQHLLYASQHCEGMHGRKHLNSSLHSRSAYYSAVMDNK